MAKADDTTDDDGLALSFGRRLAELREIAGIDGTELGRRVGMSQAHVWRLEAGRAVPNLRTMARIAVALDVSLSALVADVVTVRHRAAADVAVAREHGNRPRHYCS